MNVWLSCDMNFWQQLGDAWRGRIEDFRCGARRFFQVPRSVVVLMLIVVAALGFEAFLRISYGRSAFFGWRLALSGVVLWLLHAVRRSLR